MKHLYLLFCLLISLNLQAQVAGNGTVSSNFFDPEQHPIALRSDTSLQLLVSQNVLVKSVKARMGPDCQILKMYRNRLPKGGECLVFEGIYLQKDQQRFILSVPLQPDAQGRFYYASTQALICSSPGCNNCSISNGNCVGCCSDPVNSAVVLPKPLSKIQTNVEK